MNTVINVIKRDGSKELLDLEKLHKVTIAACEGLSGVSASELELSASLQFYNAIKSSEVQETLIKAAADLITEETPNYQYVAGRLINYQLRKEVYGQFDPKTVHEHFVKYAKKGFYSNELLKTYDGEEWADFENIVKHDRDENLTYAAMEQLRGKYLIKDRTNGKIFETPQMAFLLISATIFMGYPKEIRMQYVKDFYDALSNFDLSLPTPIMAGVRTKDKQFSSCVLIECDDSLNSIIATSGAIVKYVSKKAGIGIGSGKMRAQNSAVRNGEVAHTGVISFWKFFDKAVNSCSQGGVRKGSATISYTIFHREIEDLLVLKNNKGTEDNRIRGLDYCVQLNKLFYERLINGGNITLFSPSYKETPGLIDAFYEDDDKFRELYEKFEASRVPKKVMKAIDLFTQLMQERKDTGRIYLQHIDHCNEHGPYIREVAPIRMTNLCVEITEHTKPLEDLHDPNGEIALCTLAAVNMGRINSNEDLERVCTLLVHALDAILDYQEYPVLAAKNSTMNRRHLGIGPTNLAYWLVKNGLNYQDIDAEGLKKIHEFFEAYSYYIIKASVDLAKEKGPCPKYNETKWSQGLLPIDTYKKEVDELVKPEYLMDWKLLRHDLEVYGIVNSTLMSGMPTETSSQVSNSTNGVEPPRSLISFKQSKDGTLKQVVPEIRKYKNKYDLLWDQKSPQGYLKIMAVIQKFFDQAISVNTSYNPEHYPEGKIPMSVLLGDLLFAYKYGTKNLYYCNVNDRAGELDTALAPGIESEEDCESCKI